MEHVDAGDAAESKMKTDLVIKMHAYKEKHNMPNWLLGKKSGISESQISYILSNKLHKVSVVTLIKACARLGMSVTVR